MTKNGITTQLQCSTTSQMNIVGADLGMDRTETPTVTYDHT